MRDRKGMVVSLSVAHDLKSYICKSLLADATNVMTEGVIVSACCDDRILNCRCSQSISSCQHIVAFVGVPEINKRAIAFVTCRLAEIAARHDVKTCYVGAYFSPIFLSLHLYRLV